MRVRVVFGPSKSPRYSAAVQLARGLPSYHHDKITGDHVIDEPLSWERWSTIYRVVETVHDWRNSIIESDGENPFGAFAEMEALAGCHKSCLAHTHQARYCAGQPSPTSDPTFFGCRFLRGVRLVHPPASVFPADSPGWWEFGMLDADRRSLLVDRDGILDTLRGVNAVAPCLLCPAYRPDLAEQIVRALPSLLTVGDDWAIRYSALDPSRPLGVMPSPRGAMGYAVRGEPQEGE